MILKTAMSVVDQKESIGAGQNFLHSKITDHAPTDVAVTTIVSMKEHSILSPLIDSHFFLIRVGMQRLGRRVLLLLLLMTYGGGREGQLSRGREFCVKWRFWRTSFSSLSSSVSSSVSSSASFSWSSFIPNLLCVVLFFSFFFLTFFSLFFSVVVIVFCDSDTTGSIQTWNWYWFVIR